MPQWKEVWFLHYKAPLRNSKSDPEKTRVITETLPPPWPTLGPHPVLTMGAGIFLGDVWGSPLAQQLRGCLRHRGSRAYYVYNKKQGPKSSGAGGF